MPQSKHNNSGPGRKARDQQPRLTARKRETVDTALIALCYWLMAQRLVEEAEAHGEFDCPEPDAHASHVKSQRSDTTTPAGEDAGTASEEAA